MARAEKRKTWGERNEGDIKREWSVAARALSHGHSEGGRKKGRETGALVTLRDGTVRVAILDMTKVRISSRVNCLLPSGRREF